MLLMGGRGNAAGILEVLETIIKIKKWNRYFTNFSFHYSFFGPEEYRNWLEHVGLEVKRVELIPIDWYTRKEKTICMDSYNLASLYSKNTRRIT
jgi:hypothetical protein